MSTRPVSGTLRVYARGVAGGLLFSLPLLYTMEVWWAGHTASPARLLALLGGTLVLLLAYNWAGGLHPAQGWGENLFEAAEELALGFVTAAVVLVLIGQLTPEGSPSEWVGKLALEGAVAAVGVSVGTEQLGETGGAGGRGKGRGRVLVGELAMAVLGATLVAANVAPTEEIVAIAAAAGRFQLLGLALLSLAVAGLLLTVADVRGALGRRTVGLGPLRGTAVTYAAALGVSGALLWVFGRFDGEGGPSMLAQMVVLSFPGALGAAAGRLLLGGEGAAETSGAG